MEGFVALGAVVNIIQLIQVSTSVVRSCKQIYESASGLEFQNERLETQTRQLASLSTKVQSSTLRNSGSCVDEDELQTVTKRCLESAESLDKILKKIRLEGPDRRKRHVVKTFVKSFSQQHELDRLSRQLAQNRDIMNTSILVQLR